ncbi:thioredoxin domain-containing protein [Nocardioides lijunqiniae]|uniref:thioredoxin domain-containing protein n=1 Tax=Nocardioides lijunqiniae TaxID=2760832 RepID=UPI001878E567
MNGIVTPVGDTDFGDVVLGSVTPVLVDFHADWCGPCRQVGPVLDELAAELDWMQFVRLDVDAHPVTAAAYRVTGLPTLLVFDGGELVLSIVGARPRRTVRDLLLTLAPDDRHRAGQIV